VNKFINYTKEQRLMKKLLFEVNKYPRINYTVKSKHEKHLR